MTTVSPAERVAATVRAELARQRKSQAGLASALGLGRTATHRRVTGAQTFTVDELYAVAAYLGMPPASLLVEPEVAA